MALAGSETKKTWSNQEGLQGGWFRQHPHTFYRTSWSQLTFLGVNSQPAIKYNPGSRCSSNPLKPEKQQEQQEEDDHEVFIELLSLIHDTAESLQNCYEGAFWLQPIRDADNQSGLYRWRHYTPCQATWDKHRPPASTRHISECISQ